MRREMLFAFAALAIFGVGGCVNREALNQNKKTEETLQDKVMPVRVQTVGTDTLVDSLDITGEVVTSDDVVVGAKLGGRIVAMYKKDGDPVRTGEVIASLDTSNYRLQAQQANAQIAAARSALNQAKANAAIGPSRSSAALASAQAQLRSAKAQLQKARKGARDEEKTQAANNVAAARSNLETAKSEVERKRRLYEEGAVSKQQLDVAENMYQGALTQYENALQTLRIAQSASRPEDIESAREAVRQAEEGVRSAQAQKRLDVLLDDQVQAAVANLESAQTLLAMARQNMTDSVVRSPFGGKIAGKPAQVGTVVGAGNPIAHVIGAQGAYFEGEVSENSIAKVGLGSVVAVTIDALADRRLSGSVVAVNPLGQEVGRIFKVRVQISGDLVGVRPGMFARGTVTLKTVRNATVVPATALVQRGNDDYVFVVNGDKVKLVHVTKGLQKGTVVQVQGVQAGDKVVVAGQNSLSDDTPIVIEDSKKEDAGGSPAGGTAL